MRWSFGHRPRRDPLERLIPHRGPHRALRPKSSPPCWLGLIAASIKTIRVLGGVYTRFFEWISGDFGANQGARRAHIENMQPTSNAEWGQKRPEDAENHLV